MAADLRRAALEAQSDCCSARRQIVCQQNVVRVLTSQRDNGGVGGTHYLLGSGSDSRGVSGGKQRANRCAGRRLFGGCPGPRDDDFLEDEVRHQQFGEIQPQQLELADCGRMNQWAAVGDSLHGFWDSRACRPSTSRSPQPSSYSETQILWREARSMNSW